MDENNSNNSTKNVEKEEIISNTTNQKTESSGKKSKKIKVKAWCGECFQFFENGPFAKVCREHLTKGKCNLVECTKKLINEDGVNCTRKFPNINSENRHTYCLTEDEVKEWDEKTKIQNCLGVKRNSDRNYEKSKSSISVNKQNKYSNDDDNEIKINKKTPTNTSKNYFCTFKDNKNGKNKSSNSNNKLTDEARYEFDLNFENLFPQTNNQNYVCNLIDEINNLNFVEGEKTFIDDKLINEFNNIYFGSPQKCEKVEIHKEKKIYKIDINNNINITNNDNKSIDIAKEKKEESKENPSVSNENEAEEKINKTNENNNLSINQIIESKNNSSLNNYNEFIQDEEKIDTIFDKIHNTSKIPKSVLNKIKSAFKKKGILNAKILRLYRDKNKSWDFLIDNFKNICSQIEGVTLCLENILDGNQNKLENKI
jgi:hypothetical protein